MITKPKSVSGQGWRASFNAALDLIPERYHNLVTSEANIGWNLRGGRPSYYFWTELDRCIDALNASREPTFPNVEWNRKEIERQRQARGW